MVHSAMKCGRIVERDTCKCFILETVLKLLELNKSIKRGLNKEIVEMEMFIHL